MSKNLSKLFMDLATNAATREQFNAGESQAEIRINRSNLMAKYGIENPNTLLEMSQADIEEAIANELRTEHSEWTSLNKMNANRVNSDNKITEIGI